MIQAKIDWKNTSSSSSALSLNIWIVGHFYGANIAEHRKRKVITKSQYRFFLTHFHMSFLHQEHPVWAERESCER